MAKPAVTSRNSRSPIAAHPIVSAAIAVLVIAAIFFALYVPLYASVTPKAGDFPFFYFYLLAYMPVLAIVMWIVITLQRRLRPAQDAGAQRPSGRAR